jgi:hypothetical protein
MARGGLLVMPRLRSKPTTVVNPVTNTRARIAGVHQIE